MACQIEAISYELDFEQALSFFDNYIEDKNNDDFYIIFTEEQDSNEQKFIKMTMMFTCKAEQAIKRDRMFDEDNLMLHIKITSVFFTHEPLQITAFCNLTNIDQRYFSIEYQPDSGVITNATPITLYIKCLSNFKQTMQSLLAATLSIVNSLPY